MFKLFEKKKSATIYEKAIELAKDNINTVDADIRSVFPSCESMDEATNSNTVIEVERVRDAIMGIATEDNGEEFPDHAVTASVYALGYSNPDSAKDYTEYKFANNSEVAALECASDSILERPVAATEGYEEQHNKELPAIAVAYNLTASQQDEFTEALFPTHVISQNTPGYTLEQSYKTLYQHTPHEISGAINDFSEQNMVDIHRDPTILNADMLRLVPVYRNESKDMFDPDGAPKDIMVHGEEIKTAPLAIGKRVNLIGVSQTDTMLSRGVLNETDIIDEAVQLEYLDVDFGGDRIRLDMGAFPGNNFTFGPQGNDNDRPLNINTDSIILGPHTKLSDGSALVNLKEILVDTDYSVRLGLSIAGNLNVSSGTAIINPGSIFIVGFSDKDGNQIAESNPVYVKLQAIIAATKITGYELEAYRTNSNLRTQGQLVKASKFSQNYRAPVRTTLTVITHIGNTDLTVGETVGDLVALARVMSSSDALITTHRTYDRLKAYTNVKDTNGNAPCVIGTGARFVNPVCFEDNIDLAALVNSVRSSEKHDDLSAALIGLIRGYAVQMIRDSGIDDAIKDVYGPNSKPATLVIATDKVLEGYIQRDGDMRTISENIPAKVVGSNNKSMDGTIYLTFNRALSINDNTPSVFNFGTTVYSPAAPVATQLTREGGTSRDTSVNPRFGHYVNLPILVKLHVKGLEDITNGKITLLTEDK